MNLNQLLKIILTGPYIIPMPKAIAPAFVSIFLLILLHHPRQLQHHETLKILWLLSQLQSYCFSYQRRFQEEVFLNNFSTSYHVYGSKL
jgi:hypothetical protein